MHPFKPLFASLLFVVASLAASPAFAADALQAKELKAFFIAQKRPRDVECFDELSTPHQQKVLEYAFVGKQEQPDERARLKGIVNYQSLLWSMEAGQKALTAYVKTGVIKELPSTYSDSMERALAAFPGASRFIDKAAVLDIEKQSKAVYQEHTRQANARIEQANAKIEQANAEIEQADARIEQANAKTEQIRKEIGVLIDKFKKL